MLRTLLPLLAVVALITVACKKKNVNKTTCTSTLYGFKNSYPPSSWGYIDGSSVFGIINQSTAAIAMLSSSSHANDGIYGDCAAFNTSDNHYYVFKHEWFDTARPVFDTLLQISNSGTVTYLLPTVPSTFGYRDVLYNQTMNKLYCLKYQTLCEISITGGSYTATPIISDTIERISAIDNAGDMYYVAGDSTTRTIRKVHPGSPSSSVVATTSGRRIYGLCYNNNDNKLYGIQPGNAWNIDYFVKVDPATGSVTTLATFSFQFNYEFFSAAIDECTNRYVLSSDDMTDPSINSSYIKQIDMSGTVVQNNLLTDGVFMGLAIH